MLKAFCLTAHIKLLTDNRTFSFLKAQPSSKRTENKGWQGRNVALENQKVKLDLINKSYLRDLGLKVSYCLN